MELKAKKIENTDITSTLPQLIDTSKTWHNNHATDYCAYWIIFIVAEIVLYLNWGSRLNVCSIYCCIHWSVTIDSWVVSPYLFTLKLTNLNSLYGAIFVVSLISAVNGIIDEVNGGIYWGRLTLSGDKFVWMTRSSVNGKIDEGNYGICGGCSTPYVATFVCLFRSSINIIIGEVNGGIDGGRSTLFRGIFVGA